MGYQNSVYMSSDSSYIFKKVEGCFGDCFDTAGEGDIWVYSNAKISERARIQVFTNTNSLLFLAKQKNLRFVII